MVTPILTLLTPDPLLRVPIRVLHAYILDGILHLAVHLGSPPASARELERVYAPRPLFAGVSCGDL